MKSYITLGIIGAGNMGSGHYKNILKGKCPEIRVTAFADLKPERLDAMEALRVAAELEAPEFCRYASGEELISNSDCDAVLICVPHYSHPELAISAFKHKKHVMCEKPAGVYTLQVREMMAEADLHPELTFGMMFNQRTNPVYKKMKEIIASGELGAIKRTSWIITDWYRPQYYYDSGDWRATWSGEGGGVLLNQCPHQLDLWQWICGMPKKIDVKMHFGKWHDIEVEDDVSCYCEYENGATGTFITTTGDYPGTNRFEIVCEKGTLVCDKKSLKLTTLDVSEPEFSKTNRTVVFGHPTATRRELEIEAENPQHVGVLNAFAANILRGEPLVADGREGINGLMISNAMHLSAWQKREVELPFDESEFKRELFLRVATSRRKVGVSDSSVGDTDGTY